ncbi:MAG: pyridoxamine 5'-phosphate oxidase family protein [Verrucomicrobiota bacterium]
MSGPASAPVPDPPAAALETMRRAKFPMLATTDPAGHPRVRPVSPVRTEEFTVFVASLRRYGKTVELAVNPRCELSYLDERHDQVRIAATADVLTDRALLDEIWAGNPLLRRYLGSPDNPELIIYRLRPERVRFMREWALDYHEIGP